ncbi:MAG: primosomal protein N' [Bulleidia sp.]|nr:primosomal protein N' [Bulleidia sp.]
MELVQIWMEHPVRRIDQTYTYISEKPVEQGVRVRVDFAHHKAIGFVESCEHSEETKQQAEERLGVKLKQIEEVLDAHPLITPELHDLALWMKEQTLSTTISCFQVMLPGKVKPQSSSKPVVMEKFVRIGEGEYSLTPKQLSAFTMVQEKGEMSYSELRKLFPNQAHALIEKGALVSFEKEKEARDIRHADITMPSFDLSVEQKAAVREIETTDDAVYLIRGVTGSGKTEVYLRLAADVLEKGRQVLILVPEIALTPQMIERVSARFGSSLAIYHSGLNAQEKYEQYRRVKEGKASVAVGTRSAVFLPFADLGLIVMDEEQDSSYKQDSQPAYHCRDIAIERGRYHHCKVILGSATPTLESYARALKHVYHLITLDHRINDTLPKVTIVSLRDAVKKGESFILTNALKEKIQDRLDHGQQVILLLNRRGYSSQLRCKACGKVITCPHCDLAMSYHKDERLLRCHACGTAMHVPKACPACGAMEGYAGYGFGTQRLEEEVQKAFPEARILRMDADTTARKNSHENILKAFGSHEADILLGTQMIAKGLDFPDVTLVGVLNGDEGLGRNDYRSCEMTFDLLMQAGGRSGRSAKEGEAVFQVFDPEHYAVTCAAAQDYEGFFCQEMRFRHAGMYPPYTYLISLTVRSRHQEEAEETAMWLKDHLKGSYKTIGVLRLLKIQDYSRARIILKGQDLDAMRSDVRKVLSMKDPHTERDIRIDVNPMVLEG